MKARVWLLLLLPLLAVACSSKRIDVPSLDPREVAAKAMDEYDVNKDGFLDAEELKEVARWLNTHHQPGVPPKLKQ